MNYFVEFEYWCEPFALHSVVICLAIAFILDARGHISWSVFFSLEHRNALFDTSNTIYLFDFDVCHHENLQWSQTDCMAMKSVPDIMITCPLLCIYHSQWCNSGSNTISNAFYRCCVEFCCRSNRKSLKTFSMHFGSLFDTIVSRFSTI